MIQFVLSLSVNQIACLRAVQRYTDAKYDPNLMMAGGLPHFITGTRLLLAEKLVEWHSCPEGKKLDTAMAEGFKPWRITKKGRLVLQVIELDIQDSAEAIAAQSERLLPAQAETDR